MPLLHLIDPEHPEDDYEDFHRNTGINWGMIVIIILCIVFWIGVYFLFIK